MGAPHRLHSKRLGPDGVLVGKTDQEWTVVRVGPRKMCYSNFRVKVDPTISNKASVKSFKNQIVFISISFISPSVFATFKT